MKMKKIGIEDAKKLREKMSEISNKNAYRRLQAVALRCEGRQRGEVSEITGFNPQWIGHLCRVYRNEGTEGLLKDGRKGGNHKNMTRNEEIAFLSRFDELAAKGQIITVNDIALAYDEAVGVKHESLSTVYYLLHKHGWRKVAPKQYHPGKASDEVIETSKKLTMS